MHAHAATDMQRRGEIDRRQCPCKQNGDTSYGYTRGGGSGGPRYAHSAMMGWGSDAVPLTKPHTSSRRSTCDKHAPQRDQHTDPRHAIMTVWLV